MKKKMQQFSFLIFLFILFFTLLNMVVFPLINSNTIKNSFIIIFSFWFIMIALLFFISRVYNKEDKEEHV
jgi:positive regulator of sigma E activity